MNKALFKEPDALEFKADFFPMTVLKLTHSDIDIIRNQISATVVTAPTYFNDAPVIIDVSILSMKSELIDLEAICCILKDKHMIPIGVRGLDKTMHHQALAKGLAIIAPAKSSSPTTHSQPSLTSGAHKNSAEAKKKQITTSKLITLPIRSGTQVYARNGDLVVTASVNAGAECFADGNIHIYGCLRGKALAGANGNPKARIFCRSLNAELIAIAGHYLTSESLQTPTHNATMLQIYLKEGKITIEGI